MTIDRARLAELLSAEPQSYVGRNPRSLAVHLPEPGYRAEVRRLTRAADVLLINDETHTLSAGPGGGTRAWRLEPDIVAIGKSIGGGIPIGAYGLSNELVDRITARTDLDLIDTGGVGGTMAGNALSLAAARATLADVLTDAAFEAMIELATRYTAGVQATLDEYELPWTVTQLGARSEYRFARPAPRNGTESHAATDEDLEDYLHVFLVNRGILFTPFHNMALMAPTTTAADVDRHLAVFAEAVAALHGSGPW